MTVARLDEELIGQLVRNHEVLITVEEGARGGFGGSVLALMPAGGVPPAGAFEVTPALGARLLRGV